MAGGYEQIDSDMLIVCVHLGVWTAVHTVRDGVAHKHKKFISHSSRVWKSKIMVPVWSVSV